MEKAGWGFPWGRFKPPTSGLGSPRVSHYFPSIENAGKLSLCGKYNVGLLNRFLIANDIRIPESIPKCRICEQKLAKSESREKVAKFTLLSPLIRREKKKTQGNLAASQNPVKEKGRL